MSIISRYISRELVKIIAICLGVFIAIYLVVEFFETIDDFNEARIPFSQTLQYFLLRVPLIVQQGIPMAVLMGTLITLGLVARSNELMALKASGVSPIPIAGPVVAIALLMSLADFALIEYVVPFTSSRANYIWDVKVKERPLPSSFTQEKIWYRSDRALYNIRVLHPKRQMLEGVTIYIFDRTFRLSKRLDARKGQWEGEGWVFSDGILLHRSRDGNFTMEQFQQYRLKLKERPEDFQHLEKKPEEMTFAELGRYVAKIQSEGYDATRYQVDFQAKIAFPFTPVIMALLGIAVALFQGKRGGIAVGVAASVSLAFIYLLVFQLVVSIGYTGSLPPILAAWVPNILFGMMSLYLFAHAMH
ncbi:MAG: LPS export ABC transporter permease LptG [Syntrophobacterales bacterium]|jgi:lipopolysaccharide export system permease protein